ncbi:MAG: thioesterase family protein [Spirochaetota bacterium]|jgi:YbgC/YbaW family acyl-CoA thioester hydrolase|nr:thioesterase family protein [Spirochaetota bacterium]
MPYVYTEKFALRIHECDAYGHLNHVDYFHFMQHIAHTACKAIGWSRERFMEMNMLWVVRTSHVEFRKPLLFGSEITLQTWVATVRQSRSIRRYRFLNEQGEVCAEAMSEWILLDRKTGLPARIGKEFITDFYESGDMSIVEGESNARPLRFDFDSPPDCAHLYPARAGWRDLDVDWRINNVVYVGWIGICGLDVLEAYNWPFQRQVERGFGIVARDYDIEYLSPAALGDEIGVYTWVSNVRRVSAERRYVVMRKADGVCLARARALWAWVSLKEGKLIPLPDDFYADFKKNILTG